MLKSAKYLHALEIQEVLSSTLMKKSRRYASWMIICSGVDEVIPSSALFEMLDLFALSIN